MSNADLSTVINATIDRTIVTFIDSLCAKYKALKKADVLRMWEETIVTTSPSKTMPKVSLDDSESESTHKPLDSPVKKGKAKALDSDDDSPVKPPKKSLDSDDESELPVKNAVDSDDESPVKSAKKGRKAADSDDDSPPAKKGRKTEDSDDESPPAKKGGKSRGKSDDSDDEMPAAKPKKAAAPKAAVEYEESSTPLNGIKVPKGCKIKFLKGTNYIVHKGKVIGGFGKSGITPLMHPHLKALETPTYVNIKYEKVDKEKLNKLFDTEKYNKEIKAANPPTKRAKK